MEMKERDIIPVEVKRRCMRAGLDEVEWVGRRATELKLTSRLESDHGLGENMRNLRRILGFYECL